MSVQKPPIRIIIHSKDIENITGFTARTARDLLQKIRIAHGKPDGSLVTTKEFCSYTGIEEDLLKDFMQF
ncbi:MAG: hypothetical protein EOP48_16425 [Sphingobacteriales bacterium]|nr:MAG: hypothetical protein EOP48_16425 [Sphingobacteriales bacterium]